MNDYYIRGGGYIRGPFTREQIVEERGNGTIQSGYEAARLPVGSKPSGRDFRPISAYSELAVDYVPAELPATESAAPGATGSQLVNRTSGRLAGRYRDAYAVSSSIIGYGSTLKALAVAVALLSIVVGIGLAVAADAALFGLSGAFVGVLLALPIYQLGILILTQGQMLFAVLDTAVNTSPLMNEDDKRLALGL